ncbi:hypothetical protein C8F04DRAFT_3515 [Mycena alexandri]|uniref:Uncharacterized protein n=1 Tax=Mycena alexandri TaxID=1745969 RepID=A0AAD6TIQ0_9AGAR|nr:hypothetical protein C8F04DRAFT_3515 [Mycena alexandri]
MEDLPPPAYSKEYKRPAVNSLNHNSPAASHNNRLGDGTQALNSSKRADGRGARPLPLPPSLKTGTVSPLRLHKKSQSAVIPSIERPWKPPSLEPPNRGVDRWDPAGQNPPHFRNREADSAQMPQKYLRSPPPTPAPLQYGRNVGHFPMPPPNRGREALHGLPQGGAVDPNAFYNPAVSGHLPRSSISHMPPRNNTPLDNNGPSMPPNSRPSNGPHVRWG